MTVTGMDLRPGSSAESGGGGFSQNNLNRSSHTRTHSHPLPLISGFSQICPDQPPQQPISSTPLTDALNLDFVNIPSAPGSIPASAMEKYLVGNNNTAQEISDILVDLDLECSSTNSKSCASEVVKVLDNFNTLLEQIDDNMTPMTTSPQKFVSPTNSSAGPSSASKIKSSVEAFADLLLRGENEDEDLLIVEVELPEGSGPPDLENGGDDDIEDMLDDQEEGQEDAEADDQLCSLQGDEEDLDLEGYESDRPMVRASMRKLRPIKVKLKPVPEHFGTGSGSESSSENSSDQLCVVVVVGGGDSAAQSTSEGVVTMESGVISEGLRGTSPTRQGTSANSNTTGGIASSSEDAVTSTPLLGTSSCSSTNTTG